MNSRISYVRALLAVSLAFAGSGSSLAQTYKVNSGAPDQSQQQEQPQNEKAQKKDQPQKQKSAPPKSGGQSLGWGSNIQNARLGRAAEAALKKGRYQEALDYAQRAVQSAPGDARSWFLLGYVARLAGKTQASVDAYDHGLRVEPSSLDGQSGLAQTYARMGRREEAIKILASVLAANPRRTSDWQLLGEMQLQSGNYEESLKALQNAEQKRPEARSELLLALAHERMKQFKEAERYLALARHRSPGNPEVLRALAAFYRETGNYSAAISALKSIHNLTPVIKAELAYTYELAGKREEAAKLYVQAANAAPSDLKLQLSAAHAEVMTGEVDAAKKFLDRAEKLNPNHYRLHAIRGEIAKVEERNQDAAKEYAAALSSLPQSPAEGPLYSIQLHLNLVQIYQHLQDDAASKKELATAQAEINQLNITGKSREDFLRLRAQVKLYAGDTDGALEDIHDALALDPKDSNALQLNGDLLVKMGRGEEAIELYKKVLAQDPDNELALASLGSVSRVLGRDKEAEKYLLRLATAHPRFFVPHLGLGDLYTARKDFGKAEAEYLKAHALAPRNSLIIAGAMNAAIEGHQYPLAADWFERASPDMRQDPRVMRENERYLTWTGKYQESADVGREAIKKLPHDRDVAVYLAYDLLHLEKYDELLQLVTQYEEILPEEPDLPLLAGYVHKHNGNLEQAQAAFTRSIERGPGVATAYVNRGYVLHDLRKGSAALEDFNVALKIDPKNGEARLGLAYANLDLHRPRPALENAKIAEKEMGDSIALHLIRATAYGDEGMLTRAAAEYRAALKLSPNVASLHMALANTLYDLHEYQEAISELLISDKLASGNGLVYAQLARAYAQLRDRSQTLHYVELAEKQGPSTVYLSTGEALSVLGEQKAAMERFERALSANSDRIEVRLAIGKLMSTRGDEDDARRQATLALMEAASGRTAPPTGIELLRAADLFMGMHDYQLAETYFQRALAAGAPESDVRIGLANTYLALGDTPRAEAQLNDVSQKFGEDEDPSYQYFLSRANAYRQRHQNAQALTAFAQAAQSAGEDQAAETEMLRASASEGLRINHTVSFLSDYSVSPLFEDTTVYALDAQFAKATASTLPPPRSSIQNQWTEAFHLHVQGLPDAGGFFQVRNARGTISLPSSNTIVNRDTWDYSLNFAVNPSFHLGDNVFNFSTGIERTWRRDHTDPHDMNQDLFRQFVYMSTSSFFHWVSVRGFAAREAGPFTLRPGEHSRDLGGALDFRVGRPWSKTAFVTGWGARDEQFGPIIREFYYTSTYGGIEHRFSERLQIRGVMEYLRSWRVAQNLYAIAQAARPAGSVEYSPTRNWTIQASAAYARNMGFHAYDAVQTGFAVSYAMPISRKFEENGRELPVRYPIRFSAGIHQESFFNFTGTGSNQQYRPYFQISIF